MAGPVSGWYLQPGAGTWGNQASSDCATTAADTSGFWRASTDPHGVALDLQYKLPPKTTVMGGT